MSLTHADFEYTLVTTALNPFIAYKYYYNKINYIFNIIYINKYRSYAKPKSRLITS